MSKIEIDDRRVYTTLQLIMALIDCATAESLTLAKKEIDGLRSYLGYDPFMKYILKRAEHPLEVNEPVDPNIRYPDGKDIAVPDELHYDIGERIYIIRRAGDSWHDDVWDVLQRRLKGKPFRVCKEFVFKALEEYL